MPWDSAALYVSDVRANGYAGAAQAHRRRRRQRGVPAGVGLRRAPLFHLGQDRLGAALSLGRRAKPRACTVPPAPSCGGRSGCSARAVTPCIPTGVLLPSPRCAGCRFWRSASSPADAPLLYVGCRAKPHASTIPLAVGDGFAALVSPPVATPAIMSIRPRRPAPVTERPPIHRARIHQPRRGARVQERETADGLWHPLSAGEPALSRTEGPRRPPWFWRTAAPPA